MRVLKICIGHRQKIHHRSLFFKSYHSCIHSVLWFFDLHWLSISNSFTLLAFATSNFSYETSLFTCIQHVSLVQFLSTLIYIDFWPLIHSVGLSLHCNPAYLTLYLPFFTCDRCCHRSQSASRAAWWRNFNTHSGIRLSCADFPNGTGFSLGVSHRLWRPPPASLASSLPNCIAFTFWNLPGNPRSTKAYWILGTGIVMVWNLDLLKWDFVFSMQTSNIFPWFPIQFYEWAWWKATGSICGVELSSLSIDIFADIVSLYTLVCLLSSFQLTFITWSHAWVVFSKYDNWETKPNRIHSE